VIRGADLGPDDWIANPRGQFTNWGPESHLVYRRRAIEVIGELTDLDTQAFTHYALIRLDGAYLLLNTTRPDREPRTDVQDSMCLGWSITGGPMTLPEMRAWIRSNMIDVKANPVHGPLCVSPTLTSSTGDPLPVPPPGERWHIWRSYTSRQKKAEAQACFDALCDEAEERCTAHEDCRESDLLGRSCFQATVDQRRRLLAATWKRAHCRRRRGRGATA